MTTTDNSRADALTDEQVREAIAIAIEENGTGELMFTLARVVERMLRPVEQHEAAPGNALTDLVESYGRALLAQRTDEAAAILDCIRRSDAAPSAPLEGTGNGADEVVPVEEMKIGVLTTDGTELEVKSVHYLKRELFVRVAPRTEVAGAVPEGWKLVPIKPTGVMKDAGHWALPVGVGGPWTAAAVYQAMLDQVTAPPSADAAAASQPVSCKCRRLGDWDGAHHPLCDGAASQPAAAAGQEAVGVVHRPAPNGDHFSVEWLICPPSGAKLYTAPPAQVATQQPVPRAEVTDEQPSLTNPLTPYGMLVRALRIVAGTTLMDMAQHLGRGPAELSSIEFGRKPVRNADILDAAHFFACVGIQSTTHALTIAARAGEGQ